jgi:hypothetical protein
LWESHLAEKPCLDGVLCAQGIGDCSKEIGANESLRTVSDYTIAGIIHLIEKYCKIGKDHNCFQIYLL